MEIGEAIGWYRKIRRTCAYPMYFGWMVMSVAFIFDNDMLTLFGVAVAFTSVAILYVLLKGLGGDSDSGRRNKKSQEPPEVPAR